MPGTCGAGSLMRDVRRKHGPMNLLNWILAASVAVIAGCWGDSSAVRAFHPKVKPGIPLTEAIIEGEKAQNYDIRYRVIGRGSPEGDIEIGRYWQEPYIRITKPAPDPQRPHARPYTETGYNPEPVAAHR